MLEFLILILTFKGRKMKQQTSKSTKLNSTRTKKILFGAITFCVSGYILGVNNAPQPGGTYYQTCKKINWNDPMLTAYCPGADGGLQQAGLDYNTCEPGSTVSAPHGDLSCDSL